VELGSDKELLVLFDLVIVSRARHEEFGAVYDETDSLILTP